MPQLCLEVVNKHKYNTESRKIYIESGGISAKIMGFFLLSTFLNFLHLTVNIYIIIRIYTLFFYNHNNNLTIK